MIDVLDLAHRITRKRVYISGPLTSSGNVRSNVEVAEETALALIDLGYAPLCPHLTYYLDPHAKIKHAVWMEVDLPWVGMADALLRLPGQSKGADIECREAINRGIPIFKTVQELCRALSP